MVAIKDMEMPKDCKKCPLMGTDGNPKDLLSPMMCVAIWATTHEIKHCVGGKILDDCPLVEIEERKVGKWIINKDTICCPFCNRKQKIGTAEVELLDTIFTSFKFCKYCGAEMRGDKNE